MTTNESYHTKYDTTAQETQATTGGYVDLAGVAAEKSVTMADGGILQITFDVDSTRPEPVHVEIRDLLPDNFPLDEVGFHPDYGRENWSIEDGPEIVFESTLEPQSNLRTIYAIRPDERSDPSNMSTETEVTAAVDGEPVPGHAAPGSGQDGTEPSDSLPSHRRGEEDGSTDDSDGSGTLDLPDPNAEAQLPPESEGSAAEETPGETAITAGAIGGDTADDRGPDSDQSRGSDSDDGDGSDGRLIAQLVAELADGHGSDEDLEALGDHLSSLVANERQGRNSFDARLQRAERELNELSAYTDALSEFLDEHGSGREILDDLKDETANVQSRLETVAGDVETLDERLAAVESRDERFADRFDAIDDRHEETVGRLDGVTDRVETLEDGLSSLRDSHDGAGDRIDQLEESVETADERLDAADEARDTQRESLSAEIESIAEDLDEMQHWHRDFEQLLEEFATIGSHGEAAPGDGGAPDATSDGTPATTTHSEADGAERGSE